MKTDDELTGKYEVEERRLENYLQYFHIEDDALYIREDFKDRLRELKGKDLTMLMNIVLGNGDKRDIHKMIKAFESGKPLRIRSGTTKKEQIPNNLRWAVWERDNFTCLNCGSRKNLTIDHIYPESKGGKLTMENSQTLCKPCNSRKGARSNG